MRDYAETVARLRLNEKLFNERDAINIATLYRDAADAIEELLAAVPHWVSVEDALPETDDFVIVAVLDERGDTPYQYTDFGWYLDVASCWIVNAEQRRDITHWMPLPEPPKEVE